jgi:hypothetical protein
MSYETILLILVFIMVMLLIPLALNKNKQVTGHIEIKSNNPTQLANIINDLKKEKIINEN